MKRKTTSGLICFWVVLSGCGGESPNSPIPIPTSAPIPASSPAISYTIGGSIAGLCTSAVLQNNGGDLTVSANVALTFPTSSTNRANYAVAVKNRPDAPAQNCAISNATGAISSAHVVGRSIACEKAPLMILTA